MKRYGIIAALVAMALGTGSSISGEAGKAGSIADKTIVAWVRPANLTQRGGSVLTLEKPGGVFDAVVFGEIAVAKWMAGSDTFRRTQQQQDDYIAETAGAETLVQIAIVYRGSEVTIYRNGNKYSGYTMDSQPVNFDRDSVVLMGLRHLDAGGKRFFAGSVEDARIYDRALDAETIGRLRPDELSEPEPLAWWPFEGGQAEDRMKTFSGVYLAGGARIADGRLHLDGKDDYMLAGKMAPGLKEASYELNGMIKNTRDLRDKLLNDPHRPGYHFVTPEGICAPFDPNGAIFWKGRYHLFYIVQNEKGHCWGHASSKDMVYWRHHPIALEPGEGDEVIFSGGAFVDKEGVPTITYWGLGEGRGICIATSTDDELEYWTKSPHNPVILQTENGYAVADDGQPYGVADPSAIWIKDGRYYMLTGNLLVLWEFGQKQKMPEYLGDTTHLFVSDDLIHWEHLYPFYKSDRKWTKESEDNMCPDFFPLGNRHMLLFISHNLGCQYYTGRYENDHFYPEKHGRMTWIDNAFFAPESLLDDQGRRIMWAWIFDGRSNETRLASGWSGTMSLPRVLWLGDDGTLRMRVPGEFEVLRYNHRKTESLTIPADTELPLKDIRGKSLELSIEMIPYGAAQFGVKVCSAPDGSEQTAVFYDSAEKKLKIDTRKSSLGEGPRSVEGGPFELKEGERLRLRVFIDKSVVEAFANDCQGVMRRIYPTSADSEGVVLFARGGEVKVQVLEAWDIMPSNWY